MELCCLTGLVYSTPSGAHDGVSAICEGKVEMAQYTYNIASLSGPHTATGLANAVTQWAEPGQPRPAKLDEKRRPLHAVECLRQVEEYDTTKTVPYYVEVPLPESGEVPAAGQVVFEGLGVTARYTQRGGLQEFWSASAVRPASGGRSARPEQGA